MVEKKQRIQSNYLICNHPEEDKVYILQCQAESVKDLRSDLLEELKCWLTSIDTYRDFTIFLTTGLSSWLSTSNDFDLNMSVELPVFTVFRLQLLFEWNALLQGLIVKTLVSCQQKDYSDVNSRKLGFRWGIRLIENLWNIMK